MLNLGGKSALLIFKRLASILPSFWTSCITFMLSLPTCMSGQCSWLFIIFRIQGLCYVSHEMQDIACAEHTIGCMYRGKLSKQICTRKRLYTLFTTLQCKMSTSACDNLLDYYVSHEMTKSVACGHKLEW